MSAVIVSRRNLFPTGKADDFVTLRGLDVELPNPTWNDEKRWISRATSRRSPKPDGLFELFRDLVRLPDPLGNSVGVFGIARATAHPFRIRAVHQWRSLVAAVVARLV